MADDKDGGGRSRGGWLIGCVVAVLGLGGLCLVPAAGFWLFRAVDRGGTVPIAPIVEPGPGLGVGGPHMPLTAEAMHADVLADRKVIDLEVSAISGGRWTRVGDRCRVEVTFDPARLELPCQATIRCGETLVYGGEDLGFYACDTVASEDLRMGVDLSPSAESRDPRLAISLDEVRVTDDAGDGAALGAFELSLSRTAPGAGPPADTVFLEPVVVSDAEIGLTPLGPI